jgi:hypothetical protein
MFVRNYKNKNMYYITILDYANGSVDQYDLGTWDGNQFDETMLAHWQTEDFENFLISEGYSLKNIEWMTHSDNTIYKF